ncbi:MAG: hypothetical protein AAFR61_12655 [Bacteroidota bacterium]
MRFFVRTSFLIFGVIMPILVGLLHLLTHFTQLNTAEVSAVLRASLQINGQTQSYWATWSVMSLMMGWAFVVIGLLNWPAYQHSSQQLTRLQRPIIIMLLYLTGVLYVGWEFDQLSQLIGGIIGFAALSGSLLLLKRTA